MNLSLTSHQQRGHTETGCRFKVSSERPEKQGIYLVMSSVLSDFFGRRNFILLIQIFWVILEDKTQLYS